MLIIIVLLFGLHSHVVMGQLNIAFWVESVQMKELSDDIANTLQEIAKLQLEIEIRDSMLVIPVEALNDDYQANIEVMRQFCEMLASDEGIALVLDYTYQTWSVGLDLLRMQRIPYLRIGRTLSPFLRAFADFLRQKDANDVALLLQNEQDKVEALYHTLGGFPFRTLLVNARDEVDFVRRLRQLRPAPSYFAIFARGSQMNSAFDQIQKGGLFERAAEWHFVYLDARDRVFKYKKQVEFATKFTVNSKNLCRSLQMKDAYCTSGFTFQRGMLLSIFRTLIGIRHMNENWLRAVHVNMDCNLTALSLPAADEASAEVDTMKFDLFEFFAEQAFLTLEFDSAAATADEGKDDDGGIGGAAQPLLSYALNISINSYSNEHEANTDLAVWQNGRLQRINTTISGARRFFRISVAEAMPWSYYRRNEHTGQLQLDERGQPVWEGYCIDFIQTLALKMQFDYVLVPPSRGKYGKRDAATGRWDGIVGDLVSGETDFAVAALKMYSEREEYIDYIAPYYEQTGISIVMRKPVTRTSLFKFMTVLRSEVWLSIIAALFVTAIMIWLLDKYSPYSSQNNAQAYPYACRLFTLRESFWFALTSFTPQGGGEAPKAVSGRILVAAYWLFVVLMLATFTANLAAFLTVERMQTPVASLEQLSRQSRINYTVVLGSDTHQYFMNMKFAEDTLYRMWKELALNASADYHKFRVWDYPIKEQYGHILLSINDSGPVTDAAEGFRKVDEHENADFAFIHDSSEIKYEIANRNCNLTEVGEVFAEQPYAIAVQQGSHLADEFSYAILELQKERYFEELRAKYWNHSRLNCALSNDQEGITLQSLGGVFIATLFGLGLAMLTLAIEVIYYKRKGMAGGDAIGAAVAEAQPSTSGIIKVQPIESSAPALRRYGAAWTIANESGTKADASPPPSFEAATARRPLKVPSGIILGGSEFQVSRRLRERNTYLRQMNSTDTDLPPYME